MRAACALMAATASALRPGVSLGVDLGTSGVRVNVVEATERGVAVLSEASTRWSDADGRRPEVWISALRDTLRNCDAAAVARVSTVAVSGTSASTLLLDGAGRVARPAMMYADPVGGDAGARALEIIKARAPAEHTATKSATSALAKLLTWAQEAPFADGDAAAHQADYVAAALAAGVADERLGDGFVLCSDWHNSLKMGYFAARRFRQRVAAPPRGATWIFRGRVSRRRRGWDVEIRSRPVPAAGTTSPRWNGRPGSSRAAYRTSARRRRRSSVSA